MYLTVELYTEDGIPIEEINPIVKRIMGKIGIERLDQFEYFSAEKLTELKVPNRTLSLIRVELDKKGYYLIGEE